MEGPIVVGVDGSATSQLALEEAAAAVRGTERLVVAVFVRHLPGAGLRFLLYAGGAEDQEAIDEMQVVAEAETVATFGRAGIDWQFEVGWGDPATELMRIAEKHHAGTIVVAGRRHGALGSLAFGAVTAQLLRRWPRCLLVVHPQASEGEQMRSTR